MDIDAEHFEQLVGEEFERAISEKFRQKIQNVAFLIEDEPSSDIRREERLRPHETLLGLYRGVPYPQRGSWYGMGPTLPDTITFFRTPIIDEATNRTRNDSEFETMLRDVIRETIWHEVAHHFGMSEREVRRREQEKNE